MIEARFSRREIIKRSVALAASISPFMLAMSQEVNAGEKVRDPSVIEMYADFGCPHCYKAFQMISGYIPLMREKGIDFVFRPILPATVTGEEVLPKPVVRFFYSAKAIHYQNLPKLIDILFRGEKEKASLESFDSVYQWVMYSGLTIDYESVKEKYGLFQPYSLFLDALNDFSIYGEKNVPLFVAVKGDVEKTWSWSGSEEQTVQPVIEYVKRK